MGDTLLSKASKQCMAAEMVVKEQREKLASWEAALVDAQKEVVFYQEVVRKSVEVAIDLGYVCSWLSDQGEDDE